MVRHIVMFKLTEFASPADKQAKMQEIKTGLEALIWLCRLEIQVSACHHNYY